MERNERPKTTRPLVEPVADFPIMAAPAADAPGAPKEVGDRKEEAKRVVKRLSAIVEDHQQAALPLSIHLGAKDIAAVLEALREHARGRPGTPVPGARDEIHGYCLNRLFEELVEEPSNILFTTKTGPDTIRYDAMNAAFWIECLDLMEATYCPLGES